MLRTQAGRRAVSRRSGCTATVSSPSWPESTPRCGRALGSCFFGAPREALPAPAQEEYYWADLVGLEVVNEQGLALGRVKSLIETGANEVLVVADGDRERLLPFVEQVVKAVDVAGRLIRVDWDADW
jgi:16S rRNA processing protein RimM